MLVCRNFILSFPPTILSHFVSPTPLSLVHFCCLCMISVLHSPLYLPPASPQPSISRSLYRNRSFLRIPLAARPRFSSLRSLRFVLPHSAKVKGMPPIPFPPKFTSSTCFSAVLQRSRIVLCILHALYGMQRRICDVFLPLQEHGLIFMIASCLHATVLVPSETKVKADLISYTLSTSKVQCYVYMSALIFLHVGKPTCISDIACSVHAL